MRKRLIWNSHDPAPYESSWSIFSKLMLLNRMRPDELIRLIAKPSLPSKIKPQLRDSHWIDFDRFGTFLGVAPERLQQGFMETLGFEGAKHPSAIRHCPECHELGYHSVFFEWHVIEMCPIHDTKLVDCEHCRRILSRGFTRIATGRHSSIDYVDTFIGDRLHSACKHLGQDFSQPIRLLRPAPEDCQKLERFGATMLAWRDRVKASRDPAQPIARLFHAYQDGHDLKYRFDIVRRIAGYFPWPNTVEIRPTSFVTWMQPGEVSDPKGRRDTDSDVKDEPHFKAVFKSVQRHLLKNILKHGHARCWREFRTLRYDQAQWLSREKVCTTCVAFATWAMSSKRMSNVECFNTRHSDTRYDYRQSYDFDLNSSVAHAHIWYAKFFFLLDEIETLNRNSNVTILLEKGIRAYADAHLTREPNDIGQPFRIWLMLPNVDNLIRKAAGRCFARRRRSPTMFRRKYLDPVPTDNTYDTVAGTMFTIRSDVLYSRHGPEYVISI